jgi:ClpP class serine protease
VTFRRSTVRSVALTSKLVAQHAANRPICLSASSLGGGVSLAADEPGAAPQVLADVAIVQIFGPLAQRAQVGLCDAFLDGYDAVTTRISIALESAGAVVLVIDSPGGDVAGLEQAIARIVAKRDAMNRPIYAYVDELCASAAYWLASGICDGGIFVPESGAVGSIGAIAVHVDEAGALAKAGVKPTIIAAPSGKAAANRYEPLNKTGRARIENLVAETSERFVAAVAKSRDMKPAAIVALDADLVRGADAVRAGLADGVASFEDVLERAAKGQRTTRAMLARAERRDREEERNTMGKKAIKATALGLTPEQYKAQKRAAKAATLGASDTGILTDADRRIAALLGLDPADVASNKRRELAKAQQEAAAANRPAPRSGAVALTAEEMHVADMLGLDHAAVLADKQNEQRKAQHGAR